MFGFFVNGEFEGFWSNRVGDIFAQNTIQKMGWALSTVTVVHYSGLKESELQLAEPTIDEVRVYSGTINEYVNEDGLTVTENGKQLVRTIKADLFIKDGIELHRC